MSRYLKLPITDRADRNTVALFMRKARKEALGLKMRKSPSHMRLYTAIHLRRVGFSDLARALEDAPLFRNVIIVDKRAYPPKGGVFSL